MDQANELNKLRKKLDKLKKKGANARFTKLHSLLESFGCKFNIRGSHYTYIHSTLDYPFTVVKPHGGKSQVDIKDLEKAIGQMEIILELKEIKIEEKRDRQ